MTRSRVFRSALCATALCVPALSGAGAAHAQAAGGAAFGAAPLTAQPAAMRGAMTTITGSRPDAAGQTVTIERQVLNGTWQPLGTAVADAAGTFAVQWRATDVGRFPLRAVVNGASSPLEPQASAASAPASATADELVVYRPVKATWYGPGFFGNRTACGQRLRKTTRGVAHKTLPCGSVVEVSFGGRSVRATVIDRGPFRSGVHYDLTQATARDLGFDGLQTIGVLTVSRPGLSAAASR